MSNRMRCFAWAVAVLAWAVSVEAKPFVLAEKGVAVEVVVADEESACVKTAVENFRADLALAYDGELRTGGEARLIVGTLGVSREIDRFAAAGKIDTASIKGK